MILLARHGQTVFNNEGRFQGASDSPLTDLGQQQACRLGTLLRTLVHNTAVPGDITLWSSPLGRALTTAAILQQVAGLPGAIRVDPRLREVSLGSWDGLTEEDIALHSPGSCRGATSFDWFFRSPDGESLDAATLRLTAWLRDVRTLPGCHVVVSHGLSGRILRGAYTHLPQAATLQLDIPQDAIFRLENGACELLPAPPEP